MMIRVQLPPPCHAKRNAELHVILKLPQMLPELNKVYYIFIANVVILTMSLSPFCLSAWVPQRNSEATGHA